MKGQFGIFRGPIRSLALLSVLSSAVLCDTWPLTAPTSTASDAKQSTNRIPRVTLLTPRAARGSTRTMTVRFADADGFADLNVVKLLINRSLDEVSACSLVYDNQTDRVSLAGDTGGDQTGATAGATATLQNSQCSLDVSGVSVFRYGQTLELKFPLTFKASFSGNHIVYLAARDAQGGDSDWQPSGVVDLDDAAGPSVIALTPNESDGTVQTLTVAYRHGSASSDGARISRGQVLVNQVSDPRGACYVDYDTAENDLFLVADDGEALLPSVQPSRNGVPGGGESQNSQCAIDGAKSSLVDVGQHLYLSVHMTFKSGFEGRKIVYAAAQTGADFDTDWQAVGTTVTADRPLDIEFIPRDAEHDVPTNHRVLVSFPSRSTQAGWTRPRCNFLLTDRHPSLRPQW